MTEATTVEIPLPDGRHLAATSRGSGRPTVVFEAGMGAGRASWAMVVPGVAEHTRAVTYDRAGIGASPVDAEDRTVVRAADDLVALLRHLDDGPAVLVAHSYGGPIVREVLTIAPEMVAALVLVDQTDEGCELYFAPSVVRANRVMTKLVPTVARLGLLRPAANRMARPLPPEARRAVVAESASSAAGRAFSREMAHCDADLRRLRDHPHPAIEVPVTLISGAVVPKGRSGAARRTALLAAHQARADASPRGRHVRAERSEHLVPFTEPELVVAEIRRLVDEVGA